MQLIRMPHTNQKLSGAVVATIGNFDGVHVGHQKIIDRIKSIAVSLKLPTMVILFEPQPDEYFTKGNPQLRLTSLREKVAIFNRLGIDYIAVLPFDRIVSFSALDFVKKILCDELHVRSLVVGDDFHFGKDRIGDFPFLVHMGEQLDFTVESMPTLTLKDIDEPDSDLDLPLQNRISSSWIRELLSEGNIGLAERLLGHVYSVCGRVIHGKKLGRTLKIPTANIDLKGRILPLKGIFVVEVCGLGEQSIRGVASVGFNPTVQIPNHAPILTLEVHLLDFHSNIYGRLVEITFLYRLRDEKKFDSLEALRQQILIDIQEAKRVMSYKVNSSFITHNS